MLEFQVLSASMHLLVLIEENPNFLNEIHPIIKSQILLIKDKILRLRSLEAERNLKLRSNSSWKEETMMIFKTMEEAIKKECLSSSPYSIEPPHHRLFSKARH